jgi:hypothetical protein
MFCWLNFGLRLAVALLSSRHHLLLENAALRHQLLVLSRKTKRPRINPVDRVFWVWRSLVWSRWRQTIRLVQPDTVIHWHRQGFRLFWRWKSRARKAGRPRVAPETIDLIRQMCRANPLWGAPRIHGELLKLGLSVAQRTVSHHMLRSSRPCGRQTCASAKIRFVAAVVLTDDHTGCSGGFFRSAPHGIRWFQSNAAPNRPVQKGCRD